MQFILQAKSFCGLVVGTPTWRGTNEKNHRNYLILWAVVDLCASRRMSTAALQGLTMRLYVIRKMLARAKTLSKPRFKGVVMKLHGMGLLDKDEVEYLFTRFNLHNL